MADYIRPVVFTLGGQKFGVDINLVQSIERQVDVVPDTYSIDNGLYHR